MNKIKNQTILSLASVLALAILIIVPGWIAEALEGVETAVSDVESSTVVSSSNTTYRPYKDFNETDRRIRDFTGDDSYEGSVKMNNGLATINNIPTVTYDYSGFENMVVCDTSLTDMQVVFIFTGNAFQLSQDGITKLNFMLDLDETYYIHHIRFWQTDPDYILSATSVDINVPTPWSIAGSHFTGRNWFNSTLTSTELNNGATEQLEYPDDNCIIHYYVKCETDYTADTPFYFRMEWEPDYYEDVNNTYEPFIQEISNPYTIHKWSLGIGGVILIGSALVITPWVNPTDWDLGSFVSGSRRRKNHRKKGGFF